MIISHSAAVNYIIQNIKSLKIVAETSGGEVLSCYPQAVDTTFNTNLTTYNVNLNIVIYRLGLSRENLYRALGEDQFMEEYYPSVIVYILKADALIHQSNPFDVCFIECNLSTARTMLIEYLDIPEDVEIQNDTRIITL